jgi:hypothetical protein
MRNIYLFCITLSLLSLSLCFDYSESIPDFDDYIDNPYRVLRLPPWSSLEDIKKKYNELVKKYHPDKNKENSGNAAKFMQIQKAYERLKKQRRLEQLEKEKNQDLEDEDMFGDSPFLNAVVDTIKTISYFMLFWGGLYYLLLWTYKVFNFIWSPVFYMMVTFLFIDRLFPHYFKNSRAQYIFSFLVGLLIINRNRIYNKIVGGGDVSNSKSEEKKNE